MLGCPFQFFVPSPLSDFYEWVVLAACCLNVVFKKWAEPKNSGQKAREKSCSRIQHKPTEPKERKKERKKGRQIQWRSPGTGGHYGGGTLARKEALAFQNTHSYSLFLSVA